MSTIFKGKVFHAFSFFLFFSVVDERFFLIVEMNASWSVLYEVKQNGYHAWRMQAVLNRSKKHTFDPSAPKSDTFVD